MMVDDKVLDLVWKTLQSKTARRIITSVAEHEALTYTELKNRFSTSSNITPHYLKKLVKAKLLKCESRHYFLTKIGLRCANVIQEFDAICSTYDLTDVDTDGKLKVSVEYRHIIKG